MKKQLLFLVAILCSITAMQAQGGGRGGFQQRTVEERVKMAHEKIDSAFKPEAAAMAKIDTMFTYFYKGQDAIRQEMMNNSGGERPDFQAMQEKMKPLNDAKDSELKKYLGEENFKIYKEKIEPMLMPRRGGGPGGNRQN